MARKDINPLLKQYPAITWNEWDYTKVQNVPIYRCSGIDKLKKGPKVFEFNYEPLLEFDEYQKLLNEYDNSDLVKRLYDHISFFYSTLYMRCYIWWYENNLVKDAIDIDDQIEIYKSREISDFCCPIIRHLDLNTLDNRNFYGHFRQSINNAELKQIETTNELLYGEANPKLTSKLTSLAAPMLNSVINIVYQRFYVFLRNIQNGSVDGHRLQTKKTSQPQASLDNGDKDEYKNYKEFKNNFDLVSPIDVYKHFYDGLVKQGYLSNYTLNDYLKSAFELKKKPSKAYKLNCKGKKQKVIRVFYNYYSEKAGKKNRQQYLYSTLLGDYFEGFTIQNVYTNFSK